MIYFNIDIYQLTDYTYIIFIRFCCFAIDMRYTKSEINLMTDTLCREPSLPFKSKFDNLDEYGAFKKLHVKLGINEITKANVISYTVPNTHRLLISLKFVKLQPKLLGLTALQESC